MTAPVGSLVVALALDGSYAPWAATVLRSCTLANPHADIAFEVVHDGTVADRDCERLAEAASSTRSTIRFHEIPDADLSGLPSTDRFGTSVWLRFFLPDLLADAPRALYLDSDTLVMADLRPLFETPLDSSPIAAVPNVVEPGVRPHVRALGAVYPGGFFNSGVLLMDLNRMRAEGSTTALLEAADALRDHLIWPDQDVLNKVFAGRWKALHPRWNAQNSFWAWPDWAVEVFGETPLEEARRDPGVRHFEGPALCKPWHYLFPYPNADRYRAVKAQTPWAYLPLEDRTPTTWLIKRLQGEARMRAYGRLWRARRRLRRLAVRISGGSGRRGEGDPGDGRRSGRS